LLKQQVVVSSFFRSCCRLMHAHNVTAFYTLLCLSFPATVKQIVTFLHIYRYFIYVNSIYNITPGVPKAANIRKHGFLQICGMRSLLSHNSPSYLLTAFPRCCPGSCFFHCLSTYLDRRDLLPSFWYRNML